MKNKIRLLLKNLYYNIVYSFNRKFKFKSIDSSKRNIFLIGTPTHGNLGDQAITIAEINFLSQFHKKFNIVEFNDLEVFKNTRFIKKNYKKGDYIFFNGGGNFGSLYTGAQEHRNFVLNKIPKGSFVFFPQSAYFSEDQYGEEVLNTSKKIHTNRNIIFFSREKQTKSFIDKNFNMKNYLVPDIVLSLEKEYLVERTNITFSFRSDIEKSLSDSKISRLKQIMEPYKLPIIHLDTHIGNELIIDEQNRTQILEDFWKKIAQSKILVTDRLHGMIFGYITKTPTLVFNNNNNKIKSSYDTWLKNINYIKMVEEDIDYESLKKLIEELINIQPNYKRFDEEYLKLRNIFEEDNKSE